MNNNLILRTVTSPYGDTTKGSVLTQADVDNNFLFLKGQTFVTGTTNAGIVTLTKLNGDIITFQAGSGSTSDTYVTGLTFNNLTNVLTATRNDGVNLTTTITISGGTYYTNTATTPTTIGGIAAGSTFSAQTMQQMFDQLLYPYQAPAFASFSLGFGGLQEIGFTISTGQTFTWSTNNSTNISPNTISIAGYNLTTLTGLPNSGSEPVVFTSSVTRSAGDGVGSRSWSIQATNTHSGSFSTSTSIRWDWKMFAGTSTNTTLTANQITGLTNYNSVKTGFAGTFNMSAGGYKYFVFEDVYGSPTTFVDTSNNLNVAMYAGYPNTDAHGNTYDLVTVINSYSQAGAYRVYRTLNQLGGTINIAIN